MAGWIKVYRDLQEHWLSQDFEKLGWWVDLLLSATHKDTKILVKGKLIELKKGQITTSLSFLAERWGRSKETVLNFLRLLESDGMIDRKADRTKTLITICNYDSYQEVEQQTPTANPTDDRPETDQSPTEIQECKECKEINNITTTARTREDVEWDELVENGYLERFKAQGSAREAMKITGKSLSEIMSLLDIYRAKRKLQNRGHIDFSQFCNFFVWHLENGKLTIPTNPQSNGISGQALFDRIK